MTAAVPTTTPGVFAGIDTHADTHHVALVDAQGHPLGQASFPTTTTGYTDLEQFLTCQGRPTRVGIEGSASYGAALSHLLHAAGHTLVEVNRPDRAARRQHGKSDPLDKLRERPGSGNDRAQGTSGLSRR